MLWHLYICDTVEWWTQYWLSASFSIIYNIKYLFLPWWRLWPRPIFDSFKHCLERDISCLLIISTNNDIDRILEGAGYHSSLSAANESGHHRLIHYIRSDWKREGKRSVAGSPWSAVFCAIPCCFSLQKVQTFNHTVVFTRVCKPSVDIHYLLPHFTAPSLLLVMRALYLFRKIDEMIPLDRIRTTPHCTHALKGRYESSFINPMWFLDDFYPLHYGFHTAPTETDAGVSSDIFLPGIQYMREALLCDFDDIC